MPVINNKKFQRAKEVAIYMLQKNYFDADKLNQMIEKIYSLKNTQITGLQIKIKMINKSNRKDYEKEIKAEREEGIKRMLKKTLSSKQRMYWENALKDIQYRYERKENASN